MIFRKAKIGTKILLLVICASLLCSIGLGIYAYHSIRKSIDERINIRFTSKLIEVQSIMEKYLHDVKNELNFLTSLPELYTVASILNMYGNKSIDNHKYIQAKNNLESIFKEKLLSHTIYSKIQFICPEGMERIRVDNFNDNILIVPSAQLQNISDKYYFKKIIALGKNETYKSPIELNRKNGQIQDPNNPTIKFGMPYIRDDKLLGILIFNMNVRLLFEELEKIFTLDEGENLLIINSDSFYLMNHLNPEYEWGSKYDLATGYNIKDIDNGEIFRNMQSNTQGEIRYNKRIIYFRNISIEDYDIAIIAVDIPLKNIMSAVYKFTTISIIFMIILLCVISIFSYIITRKIVKPINKLKEGMDVISDMNYSITLPIHADDEIGDLTRKFNEMNANLKSYTSTLIRLFELGVSLQTKEGDIFKQVINIILKTITVEMCGIGVIEDREINFLSFFDKGYYLEDHSLSMNNELCMNTLLESRSYFITNAKEEYQDNSYIQDNDIHTLLAVPIVSSKEVLIGVIMIMDKRRLDIQKNNIELMFTLSRRISFEIEQAQSSKDIYEKEREIEYLSKHEKLTNLPNKVYMRELIDNALKQAIENNYYVGLVKFKVYNYSKLQINYGTSFTDSIMQYLAQKIQQNINETDILAHTSRSEFTMIISQAKSKLFITNVLIKIMEKLYGAQNIDGKIVFLNIKSGVSIFPSDTKNTSTLFKYTDLALGNAIADTQKDFAFYLKGMEDSVSESIKIENALIDGLEKNKFSIVYQPQVNSATKKICGSEALLRFNDPEIGNVSPIKFIQILEDTGLIYKVGEWILEHACKNTKSLHDEGFHDLKIAVNISSLQFKDINFINVVQNIVKKTGINASFLELEITEGIIIDDIPRVNKRIRDLHRLGIRIAIDDFGTGYSSMRYLKLLDIDKLKIDRAFVKDIPGEDDGSIATTIIELSRNFGMDIIAEGAETDEQIQFLHEKGCDLIQGYYFSPPLSYENYINFLKEFNV